MAVVAQLSGVYFQASGYGAVLNLKSIGLRAASAECPFAFVSEETVSYTHLTLPTILRV